MTSVEGLRVDDDSESDEAAAKKKKEQEANAVNSRWRASLPRGEGFLNQRKDFALPLDQFLKPSDKKAEEESSEDDDEEDEKADKEASEVEVSADEAAETAETSAEGQGEVFETIVKPEEPARVEPSEFMDIPQHVDEDKPSIPLTSEENKAFSEMAAGIELSQETRDIEERDASLEAIWDMPETEHPLGEREAAPPAPASAPGGYREPFWRPAASAPSETGSYASGGAEMPAYSGGGESSGLSSGVGAAIEALKAATNLAELANNPNRLVTRVLTQVAVEGFLKRKQEQHGNEAMLRRQREEIARLHDEQRRTNEQLAGHLQHDTLSPDEQLEIFDQEGNRIILQPGWRVERSAGGYSVVVDRHGRVVHEAIRYGEAFQREQQREQLSDDIFAALKAGGAVGTHADGDGAAQQAVQANGQLQGIPAGGQHMLPASTDHDGQSAKKRKRLDDALMNPWLWFAVAVLIIVYFLAALA